MTSPNPRAHSLEVRVDLDGLRSSVHLVGVNHASSDSMYAVGQIVRRHGRRLAAVAVECDTDTFVAVRS